MTKYYYHKYEKSFTVKGIPINDVKWDYAQSLGNYYKLDLNTFAITYPGTPHKNMKTNEYYIDVDSAYMNKWNSSGWVSYAYLTKTNRNGPTSYRDVRNVVQNNLRISVSRSQLSHIKGDFIETIKAEEGTYPDNGLYTDGYWYVKGDKATIPISTNIGGAWIESETAYENINGAWKEIKEIHQKQNGAWVKLF